TYGKGLYVAVGDLGTVLTSASGVTWQRQNTGLSFASLNDVAFGNDVFAVVKDDGDGTSLLYSSNGTNWVNLHFRAVNMRSIVFAQGRFVAVGNDGFSFTSTNGSSWTQIFTGNYKNGDNLRNITYANGIWAIVGNDGIIITSSDLTHWRRRYCPTFVNLHGVRYLPNGTFAAIGNGGTVVQSDSFAHLLQGAQRQNGYLLTLYPGLGETVQIQKSANLINWTNLTTFTNPPNQSLFIDHATSDRVGVYRAVSP